MKLNQYITLGAIGIAGFLTGCGTVQKNYQVEKSFSSDYRKIEEQFSKEINNNLNIVESPLQKIMKRSKYSGYEPKIESNTTKDGYKYSMISGYINGKENSIFLIQKNGMSTEFVDVDNDDVLDTLVCTKGKSHLFTEEEYPQLFNDAKDFYSNIHFSREQKEMTASQKLVGLGTAVGVLWYVFEKVY